MTGPVAVLAVLSVVGGWLQFPKSGRRSPTGSTRWRCRSSRRPGRRRRSRASLAVALGLAGSPSPGGSTARAARRRRGSPAARAARAQALVRRGLRRRLLQARRSARDAALCRSSSGRSIGGSLAGVAQRLREVGLGARRAPDRARAHVRARARRRPRRPRRRLHRGADDRLAHDHPDLPADRGRARRAGCCRCRRARPASLALLVALVEVGFWIAPSRASTSTSRAPVRPAAHAGSATSTSRTTSACLRLLALARRPDRRRDGGRDRLRASGSAATGRAPTTG